MKITTILLFIVLFQLSAVESCAQTAKVSVQAERLALSDLFGMIENQSEFLFFYVDSDIKDVYVDVHAQDKQIKTSCLKCFPGRI